MFVVKVMKKHVKKQSSRNISDVYQKIQNPKGVYNLNHMLGDERLNL